MTNQIDNSPDPWLMNDKESSGNQIDLSFQDNFTISSSEQESSTELVRLPDSQHYINSLEKKLDKLKGKTSKEPSTRDVICSLEKKRDGLLEQFLSNYFDDFDRVDDTFDGDGASIGSSDVNIANGSLYSNIERRLFPHKQALNEEELKRLLDADFLERLTQQQQQQRNNEHHNQNQVNQLINCQPKINQLENSENFGNNSSNKTEDKTKRLNSE